MAGFKENISVIGDNMTVKGKATIQMFNDQGELVSETVQNNFVSPRYLNLNRKLSPYGSVYTYSYAWMYPHQQSYASTWDTYGQAHSAIALTTNTKDASPTKDRYIEGDLVGWGRVSEASGGSVTKATFNTNESVASPYYRKMVYDFDTSAGNGVFQSIYTYNHYYDGNYGVTYNYTGKSIGCIKLPVMSGHTITGHRVFPYKNFLYYLTYSSSKLFLNKIKVNDMLQFDAINPYNRSTSEGIVSHEALETDIPYDTWGIHDFTIYKDVFYLATGYGILRKAPMSNLKGFSQMGTFTQPVNQPVCLFYSNSLGKLVIVNQYQGKFNFFDLNGVKGTELTDTTMGTDIGRSSSFESSLDSAGYVHGYMNVWDIRTMKKVTAINTVSNTGMPLNDELSVSLSGGYAYIRTNQHFFSRVVLDSPVTKTSQNTMKITYEFIIEPFKLDVDYTLTP